MNHATCYHPFIVMAATIFALHLVNLNMMNAQTVPNDKDAWTPIEKLLDTQAEKWNDGDIDGFMTTYWNSPDLTFSGGGQTTRGWQATMDRYKTRYPDRETMGTLKFDNLEFRSLGENAALVLGNWHLTTNKGNPQGNFSLVLQRIDENWLIVHDHSSTEVPRE